MMRARSRRRRTRLAVTVVVLLSVGAAVQPAGASPRQDPGATDTTVTPAVTEPPAVTTTVATATDPAATAPQPTDIGAAATTPTTAAATATGDGAAAVTVASSSDQPALLQQAVDKANREVAGLADQLTAAEEADVQAREAAAKRDQDLEAERVQEEGLAKKARSQADEARVEGDKLAKSLKNADEVRVGASEGWMTTVGKLRTFSVAAYVANSAPPGLPTLEEADSLAASRRREFLRSSGRAHVTRTREAEAEVAEAETTVADLAKARSAKVDEEQRQLEIESGHLGKAEAVTDERSSAEQAELTRRQSAAEQRLQVRKDLERANTIAKQFTGLSLDQTTAINGEPLLTGEDLSRWFTADGRKANTTVSIQELTNLYVEEGRSEGIRADIAFAQSILETGSFGYPSYGQVKGTDNNFAGIGACDSCTNGFGFPDARTGVRAQMQLLKIYANPGLTAAQFANPKVRWDPEKLGVRGCCPTWKDLAGVWASNTDYFSQIQTVWNEIVTWVVKDYVLS